VKAELALEEARRIGPPYNLATIDDPETREGLHEMAFDQLRSHGINPDSLDGKALNQISELVDWVFIFGMSLPIVEPLRCVEDHMEFDRQICAAGLKRFVRRILPSDLPAIAPGVDDHVSHVLVAEHTPGLRSRIGLQFVIKTAAPRDRDEES
jgi:hypothetical protein